MTTDQAKTDNPMNRNPEGRGGFGDNPSNRNPGGWKKEDTLRFKIEKASFLSTAELQEIADDESESALLRKFAEATVKADWRMIKEITEMLYGKPKETVDISNPDGTLTPVIRIIDERPKSD